MRVVRLPACRRKALKHAVIAVRISLRIGEISGAIAFTPNERFMRIQGRDLLRHRAEAQAFHQIALGFALGDKHFLFIYTRHPSEDRYR
jgi:hypothetical protein